MGNISITIFDDRWSTLLTSAPAASVSSLLLERRLRRDRVETVHPNHSGALNGGERAQTLLGRHFDRGFRSRGQVEVVCAGHVEHACHGTECKLRLQALKPTMPYRRRHGDDLRHTSVTLKLASSLFICISRTANAPRPTQTTVLIAPLLVARVGDTSPTRFSPSAIHSAGMMSSSQSPPFSQVSMLLRWSPMRSSTRGNLSFF